MRAASSLSKTLEKESQSSLNDTTEKHGKVSDTIDVVPSVSTLPMLVESLDPKIPDLSPELNYPAKHIPIEVSIVPSQFSRPSTREIPNVSCPFTNPSPIVLNQETSTDYVPESSPLCPAQAITLIS